MTIPFKAEYTSAPPKCTEMPTREAAEKFFETASKLYEEFYSPDSTHEDPCEALGMFFKISDMWYDLIGRNTEVWYDGNNLIAQAIGTTFMYWDTDVVDQLDFCEELARLVGLDPTCSSN